MNDYDLTFNGIYQPASEMYAIGSSTNGQTGAILRSMNKGKTWRVFATSSQENGGTPFTGGFEHGLYLNLGFLFIPFVFFVVLGTDNGVNFTDGLDGLCTSVTILVATFLTIISIGENSGISPITGAVVGSLLGFLLFNVYPAKVFMGDTLRPLCARP